MKDQQFKLPCLIIIIIIKANMLELANRISEKARQGKPSIYMAL